VVRAYLFVCICHFCGRPTYVDESGHQHPGVPFGEDVKDVPEDVGQLYDEARHASSANAYTAAVLCCRKILMHVAVSKGAKPGASFADYVGYLADNNYVPAGSKSWVDEIRRTSNEANHDIVIAQKLDAEELLRFVEMLLKVMFEYPASALKRQEKT